MNHSKLGVGTTFANTRGDGFRMPIRRSPHAERVVRSPRPTFEQLLSKVTVGTTVSFR
jgi:hypothetical protein